MLYRRLCLSIATCCALAGTEVYAQGAKGPSYDCKTNRGKAEQTICNNAYLSQLDLAMAALYYCIVSDQSRRQYKSLKDDQRDFLRDRDSCGDSVRCLRKAYRDRIEELKDTASAACAED
jgi:uncharacterized protein